MQRGGVPRIFPLYHFTLSLEQWDIFAGYICCGKEDSEYQNFNSKVIGESLFGRKAG